jgi:hypothetical protein
VAVAVTGAGAAVAGVAGIPGVAGGARAAVGRRRFLKLLRDVERRRGAAVAGLTATVHRHTVLAM